MYIATIFAENVKTDTARVIISFSYSFVTEFDEIWVSTDDTDIAAEAEREGALVHNRSEDTATDLAPSILAVAEFLDNHTGEGIFANINVN